MLLAPASNDSANAGDGPVIYVAPDCTDAAVQRRVRGFVGAGADLVSFSFRRRRYNAGFVPEWSNVELGITTERRLVSRVFSVCRAIQLIYRHRGTWRAARMLCARNLDLAIMALIGRVITRSRAPLVYEVLDVHPATARRGLRSTLMRWLERRVLARSEVLVVSSPAFLREYFLPVQHYSRATFLLENRWPASEMKGLPRKVSYPAIGQEPVWTIGWFGNIRCERSLEILAALADALGDRVRIYVRGCASLLGQQRLLDAVAARANMFYEGEYQAPRDLPEIYSKIHFNWCVDLGGGKNSDWLLPNRLYEGGYFGVPAIAIGNHETGRVVEQRHLGIAIDFPVAEHLCRILSAMTREDYERLRRGVEALADDHFVDEYDHARLIRLVGAKRSGRDERKLENELEHGRLG